VGGAELVTREDEPADVLHKLLHNLDGHVAMSNVSKRAINAAFVAATERTALPSPA